MARYVQYDASVVGKKFVPTTTPAFYYYKGNDNSFRGVSVTYNAVPPVAAVVLNGYKVVADDGVFYQLDTTDDYNWIFIGNSQPDDSGSFKEYIPSDHTLKQSESLITEIVRYNQNIVNNNILCAQMLATIPEGRMPASERTKAENTIRYLQKRAEESQQKLVDDGYITNVQYGAPVDYKYISALNTIRNGGSVKPVGVLPGAAVSTVAAAASSIPVWGWVVAAFVIGIALTAGVWYAYVKMRDERVGDLKNFSEPLMQTLQSYLPDDVYNQAVEELNERVDEAYKRGKQNSMSELFDKVLIAGAAFLLTYALIKGDER